MNNLFPEIEPYKTEKLKVSSLHEIYVEQSGNPDGQPILFLHGGPGGATDPKHRRYFDPKHYRIILFDQRGCGKSTPRAEIQENTTWDLVHDIEHIRKHLGIRKWIIFGGSWGSTLALSYAIRHSGRVLGLILRGIFLCSKEEIQWFYQDGASKIFPDIWESYLAPIAPEERNNMVAAYYKQLTSTNKQVQLDAAKAWSKWEAATSRMFFDEELISTFDDNEKALEFARIENHYFTNNAFFEEDNFILNNVQHIQQIPGVIVHGRYDIVCPVKNAWDLAKLWPGAQLHIVQNAGHSASEEGITQKLLEATEAFKTIPIDP